MDTSTNVDTSANGNIALSGGPKPVYGYGTVPAEQIPVILLYGDAPLRIVSTPVESFGPHLEELARQMAAAMYRANGIGLAGPQVGVNQRVIVVSGNATNGATYGYDATNGGSYPIVFVNPTVLAVAAKTSVQLEYCLSFPRVSVQVERPEWVDIGAHTTGGEFFELRAENLYARVLLHEIEHLDGILLVDHAKSFKASQIKQRLHKTRRRLRR